MKVSIARVLTAILVLLYYFTNQVSATTNITVSTTTPEINQPVIITFVIPDDGSSTHIMQVRSDDGSVNTQQETNIGAGLKSQLSVTLNQAKTVHLSCYLFKGNTTAESNSFTIYVGGNNAKSTTVSLTQTGISNGMPILQASLQGANAAGSYTLIFTNPLTEVRFSQTVPSDGKSISFSPSNFTKSGTYSYVLQLAGSDILSNSIQLSSTKNQPAFSARVADGTLTITVSNADDYVGQPIQFQSGTYSGMFTVTGANMLRAYPNVSGTTDSLSFFSTTGPIGKISLNVPTTPPTNGGSQQDPSNDGPGPLTPPVVPTPVPTPQSGGSTQQMIVTLGKTTYSADDVLVTNVSVDESQYANRSVTLRVAADSSSVIKLLTLNQNGHGEATVKLNVPLNSSRTVNAVLYAINGDTIDSASAQYNLLGQVNGSPGNGSGSSGSSQSNDDSHLDNQPIPPETANSDYNKSDGQFGSNAPSVEYVAVDLTQLQTGHATLAWYRANHVQLYTTKLLVTNTTTHESHYYTVWMPNGDGKVALALEYGGPGVYTWILTSGGKMISQAPYSTPVGIDGAKVVSQDGLPVLITPINSPVDQPQTEAVQVGGVNGANIGNPIGSAVSNEPYSTASNPLTPEQKKSYMMLIVTTVILLLLIAALVLVFLRRRKALWKSDNTRVFAEYAAGLDDTEQLDSFSSEDFEEINPEEIKDL